MCFQNNGDDECEYECLFYLFTLNNESNNTVRHEMVKLLQAVKSDQCAACATIRFVVIAVRSHPGTRQQRNR